MLFLLSDARKIKPLDDAVKYPDADVNAAGALASDALEHACAVHFAPTAFTETLDGNGCDYLLLSTQRPTSITSITVGAVAVTGYVMYPDGRLYLSTGWTAGQQNVIVTGVAGWAVTPPRVAHAALLLAKRYLVDTPVNDRATTLTNPDGTTQFFVTAGIKGSVFDVPEANAVVADYGLQPGLLVA